MSTRRNDSCHPKLCRLSCMLVTSTPPKIQLLGPVFWGLQNPYAEIQKFLTGVRSWTLIHVCCFKHGLNRCWISVKTAALYWWQKNTFWMHLAEPQFLWGCALRSHTYISGFIQIHSGLGSYNWKSLQRPPSDFNTGSLSLQETIRKVVV